VFSKTGPRTSSQGRRGRTRSWSRSTPACATTRVRDELLDVEEFSCLAEAQVVISDWQEDYNQRRPHSSLGMKAPAVFAADWAHQAAAGRRVTGDR
jgi:putative transposase